MANKRHTVMRKIILYLQTSDDSQISWTILGETGAVQQTILNGDLKQFIGVAENKEIIVIVPAQDVLLTQIKMPKLNRHRLYEALPYALEDQVLSEISELHFAAGPYLADNMLPVAIVKNQTMDAWLNPLKEHDIHPTFMIPASLTLPVLENHWQIAIHGEIAIVRVDTYQGFACDKKNLAAYLTLKLAEQAQKPSGITINNYTQDAIALSIDDIKITEKTLPEKQFIEDIARETQSPNLNLLQDAYQARRKTSENKNIWLIAGYVFAAWIGVLFLSNIISYFILHHQESKADNQINQIYYRNFPNATSVVAPKDRMVQKLDALTTQGHKNRILLWLAYIGKSLPQAKSVHIQQLDYRNNLLIVSVTAASFDNLDIFSRALTQQGLTVKQQNVGAAGTQVKGDLLITEGGKS